MTLNRFSAAFLAAWIPAVAIAAAPTIQEANESFRQGNNAAALEKVNGFLANAPKDAQGRFLKGLILTELNRYNEAIKVFTDLTADYPELPEPYNNLAVLYAAQADYERAKQSLEMAIRTHPSYATAHENLGDIYAKMASQAYDKALQLDQSNTSAMTKLALIRELFSPAPRPQETAKAPEGAKRKTGTSLAASQQAAVRSVPVSRTIHEAAPETVTEADAPALPDPAPPQPAPPADAKAAIEQVLRDWADAWSRQDAAAYLQHYGDQFKVPDGRDRAAWEAERKERLARPQFIKVAISKARISVNGDTATARFQQHYASNLLKSSGRKALLLARQGDAWKIVDEQ